MRCLLEFQFRQCLTGALVYAQAEDLKGLDISTNRSTGSIVILGDANHGLSIAAAARTGVWEGLCPAGGVPGRQL